MSAASKACQQLVKLRRQHRNSRCEHATVLVNHEGKKNQIVSIVDYLIDFSLMQIVYPRLASALASVSVLLF
jgi:hypothetical protein